MCNVLLKLTTFKGDNLRNGVLNMLCILGPESVSGLMLGVQSIIPKILGPWGKNRKIITTYGTFRNLLESQNRKALMLLMPYNELMVPF